MSTRSLTKIYDQGVEVFCMYKQYDGYVEKPGLGSELKQLMQDYVENCSDYSAQAIKSLICAVYMSDGERNKETQMLHVGAQNVGEEFTYRIYCDSSGKHSPMILYHYLDDLTNTTLLWSAQSLTLNVQAGQR